jgi:hypothetical protein
VKTPLKIDDRTELMYRVFTAENHDKIVAIDDRFYQVRFAGDTKPGDPPVYYTMVRIGPHQRSLRGSLEDMILAVGRIHAVYRDYENRVRRLKEEAQRERDRRLNGLLES